MCNQNLAAKNKNKMLITITHRESKYCKWDNNSNNAKQQNLKYPI